MSGLQHLKLGCQSTTLDAWNLDVAQRPIVTKARVLDAPALEFLECVTIYECTNTEYQLFQSYHSGSSKQKQRVPVANGQWEPKAALKATQALERWLVVIFAVGRTVCIVEQDLTAAAGRERP